MDIIFYYLQKKAKIETNPSYSYTTVDCFFKNHIDKTYKNYYQSEGEKFVTTQKATQRCSAVTQIEKSIITTIRGYSLSYGISCYLLDEVYIPITCDREFH